MRGYRRELTEDRDLQHNQKVAEEHVDDLHYIWRLGPQDFALLDGVAIVAIGNPHIALSFPDGATAQAFCEKHRPAYWISGNLRVTIYYTGDAASTNNVRMSGRVSPVAAGGNLAGTIGTAFAAVSAPGPTVIGDEKSLTFAELVPVDASHRHIALKITRLGADAADLYAGNLLLTQVVAEFVPAGQQL